jgi:hypothetical protein
VRQGFEDQVFAKLGDVFGNDDRNIFQIFVRGPVADMEEIPLPDQGDQVVFHLAHLVSMLDDVEESLDLPLLQAFQEAEFAQPVLVKEKSQTGLQVLILIKGPAVEGKIVLPDFEGKNVVSLQEELKLAEEKITEARQGGVLGRIDPERLDGLDENVHQVPGMEEDFIEIFSLKGRYLTADVETFFSSFEIFRHNPFPFPESIPILSFC